MKRVDLIIIDGQNDFLCPPPGPGETFVPGKHGALSVAGADQEAERLAAMINRLGRKISKIHATLDSHHPIHIAHPIFWKDEHGNHPDPFTIISADDVRQGRWTCTLLGYYNSDKKITFQDKALSYVEILEKNGRYPLCIWPPHCLIGTPGHNVYGPLFEAYNAWIEDQNAGFVNYVIKGDWPFTEHYSAIQADVPDPAVPKTQINADLLKDMAEADIVVWAGWAGSHCLANTGRDAVNYFGQGENPFIKKSVLLTDVCAPVGDLPGSTMFHDMRENFIKEMDQRGMQLATTDTFLT